MKRIIVLFLAAVLTASLAACSSKGTELRVKRLLPKSRRQLETSTAPENTEPTTVPETTEESKGKRADYR